MLRFALLAIFLLSPLAASALAALPAPLTEIRALLRAGNVDAAVDASERAVKALSADARAWLWAGRAYGRKAMNANILAMPRWAGRSRSAFEKAVELDPALIDARLDLLSYYLMAPAIVGGGRDKADAQAAAIAALDASMGKVAAARLAGADKQPAQAKTLLQEALALNPTNLAACQSLANMAGQDKDWATIRALWQEQLAHGEHSAYAHYQLGRLAAVSGEQLEQGLAHLDAFIADGELPDELSIGGAEWRRGQILDKLGRRDEALAALEIALRDETIADLARKDIERIKQDG